MSKSSHIARNTWPATLLLLAQLTQFCPSASASTPSERSSSPVVDASLFNTLEYRLIGPFRGGRVTAVAGVATDRNTFYMGTTGGGVWRTTDGGGNWTNISDGQIQVGSIGAIAVAGSDPNVIYVGTGSACPRGNVSVGDGMYKTTDMGRTWRHIGLKYAGQIARIRIHPDDPEILYVAVLGNVFGPNEERGVFRSRDGGKSWEKVLYVNDKTGAVDLSMDMTNPRILYAATWRVERKPWTLIDGGPDGAVYKTTDEGNTWEKLDLGLGAGAVGRIGVSVSPANPDRLWVLVETKNESKGGIYRSDDAGKSFERINREHELRQRAWYYNHIIADPLDENTVYVMNVRFHKSVDGGKTFERIQTPHGDNHDLWIHPQDSSVMINGNDGGANVSHNGGATWSTQENQPTAEFYRVAVDDQFPFRVYGAQQDNSTISVPSWSPGGITPKQYWFSVGGGESGHIAVDPANPDIIYAGTYIGQITRLDRRQGHLRNVTAYPQMHDGVAPRDIRYRFQWNAPIRISPHNPQVLYHTSQYVHRSTDGGQTWEVISPDLTTNNDRYHDLPGGPVQHDHTGVELYTTIFSFEESPHEPGVLWAGSDDGLLHISRNNGETWRNITPEGMPREGTINSIELSAHQPGGAYIAVYRYRENDFRPYIFSTSDYGDSWRLLTDGSNGIPVNHFVRVVREDPDRKGLLYAGTEFGMYLSFDGGGHWQPFQLNLPATPITDLKVHEQSLVVATQGRSFWILDNLTPVHQMKAEDLSRPMLLYRPKGALRTQLGGFKGPSAPKPPARGVEIYFVLKGELEDAVKLEILESDGRLIRRFSSEAEEENAKLEIEPGLNRLVWDLSYPKPEVIKGSIMSLARVSGPKAPPGSYQVRLTIGELSQTRQFQISKDPRWTATDGELREQFGLARRIADALNETHRAIKQIRSVREQVKAISERAIAAGFSDTIGESAEALDEKLTAIEDELIQTRNESDQDPINYPPKLDNQFAYLLLVVNRQDSKPTQGCYLRFEDLEKELKGKLEDLEEVLSTDLKTFNQLLDREGVSHVFLNR